MRKTATFPGLRAVAAAAVASLALVGCGDTAELTTPDFEPSPIDQAQSQDASERYIVVFNTSVGDVEGLAEQMTRTAGGHLGHVYQHALKGFSVALPAAAVAGIRTNPNVAYVEPDRPVQLFAQTVPTGVRRVFADDNANIGIGTGVAIDVDIAILDTGIDFEHPDLNVAGGVSCLYSSGGGTPWSKSYYCDTGGDDDHYHGTHVAGTAAALDNGIGVVGVAPGARLWAVKVLDSSGSGYESGIVAGIDWIAANAATIEVANMSLGGSGWSQAEYDAIQGAVDAGVAFAVAAGNSDADANNSSPAAFDNVLTVSALADFDGDAGGLGSPTCRTDEDDTLADFSNWGAAVQIAAPGVCIYSTYPIEQGEYGTISGTSMASPHAAGALALLASSNNPGNATDVYALYDQLMKAGNTNWVDDSGDGIQEPLLDVSSETVFAPTFAGGTTEPANTAPVVTIDSPADGATFASGESVTFTGSATDTEDEDLSGSIAWTSSLDGSLGSGGSVTYVLTDGTHEVIAQVTDTGGLAASDTITVTVGSATEPTGIDLSVTPYKVRGVQTADLSWTGGSGPFDVYRDGGDPIASAVDGNTYTDSTGQKGGGSATYQVCEAGTTVCSNAVTVTF